jgi:hypothetical protein
VSATVVFALTAVGSARVAAGTAAHPPRLALERTAPLTVKGQHFRAHERVRLVLHQPTGTTRRRATAGSHGRLRRVFRGVTVDRCVGLWVSATGSAGSHATVVHRALPECPPE